MPTPSGRILVVEDNDGMRKMLQSSLRDEGYDVEVAGSAEQGAELLARETYDLLLTDLRLPGRDGISLLEEAQQLDPSLSVLIMTAFGTIETAVKAVKLGADDFITKPFDIEFLLLQISRALEKKRLERENLLLRGVARELASPAELLGQSPAFLRALDDVRKVGASDATVLLLGESGTGKELLARAIHNESPRRDAPFVAINCAAIPENLLENELFGHERGAYTGAERRKLGKFELADRGSIFLDEIGDFPLALQPKLLRVLQERTFERVGGTRPIRVNIRIIAATNQDIRKQVRERRFREDLYYRLNVFPITIPPLRERREDIPLLAQHFVRKFARDLKKPPCALSPAAVQRMMSYQWPGNVRELQNCIERAVILAGGAPIQPEHLSVLEPGLAAVEPDELPIAGTLQQAVQQAKEYVERRMIEDTLRGTLGNKAEAARILAVNYKTLLTKIKEYGIDEWAE